MCDLKENDFVNFLSQNLQLNTLECTIMCAFRECMLQNVLSQTLQLKGRSLQ